MHRFFRAVTVTALAVGAADVWLATDLAAAQTPAATPNAWSPARLPDGQPDIQGEGFWSAVIGTDEADDIEKGSDVLHAKMAGRPVVSSDMIVDPPDHRIPYTPEAAAIKNRRYENRHHSNAKLRDPIARCLLAGVPRFEFLQPFRIIQNPEYVLFLYRYRACLSRDPAERASAPCGEHQAVEGGLARPLGGKYVGRGRHQSRRAHLVRPGWRIPQRCVARGGTLHVCRCQHDQLRGDARGPEGLYQTLEDRV